MRKIIKIILIFISILILYFAFDYYKMSTPKYVKFQELDQFRNEITSIDEIDNIEIYFSRPSLYIEINSNGKLSENSIDEIKRKLKPILNKENMDKISEKYWAKNTSLFYVNIIFNMNKENLKTKYQEIELMEENGYYNWD